MKQYEMVEFSYHGQPPEGSETRIPLTAVFEKGEKTCRVKGFYGGNGVYKVRWLPEEAGTWQVRVEGLFREERELFVEPADDVHHGIVRAEGTHLVHADGTWFYSFGTTVYALAHQEKKLVQETLESLGRSPFNKVRMCVFPKHYHYNQNDPEHYALQKEGDWWDTDHPDFVFWEEFEQILRQLEEMGIQVDLILFHPYDRWGHSRMSREQDLTYLDYLIRRLAAFPNLWWSMANEYDLFAVKELEDWFAIEEFIAREDPYRHLLSNHNCFAEYDYGRENISHVSLQHRILSQVAVLQQTYHKPVLYDEVCYEGNLPETWGSISGEEMSNRFWKVTVTGGWCTHGETYLEQNLSEEDIEDAVVWWAKGGRLIGTSPARIWYLRDLIESLPGPLDPYPVGWARFALLSPEEIQKEIETAPDSRKPLLRSFQRMSMMEKMRHIDEDFRYAGHVGEEVYLFYFEHNCHSRAVLELPEGQSYRLELIDTWNMTREVLMEQAEGRTEISLPGTPWMAVLATKHQDFY